MSPKDVLNFAKENKCTQVDLKFCDMLGTWQHLSIPLHQLTEESFKAGFAFDGSSIRGWKSIHESDMLMIPDPKTAKIDPFMKDITLSLICDIHDPITLEPYDRDPRQIAKKAMAYLKSTGVADQAYFGPEAEFFIFDDVRYEQGQQGASYKINSDEAHWNSGRDENGKNLGFKVRPKEGYFPALPFDTLQDIRAEICNELEKLGIVVERHHHEVATAGQCEINFRFDSLVECADNMMWFKYVVRNVAKRHGKVATFMPKPIFGDNGSGMHCHVSLWKDNKPLFAGDRYADLSDLALNFIGGILKNAPSLCAITNPITNSYKRLVPGFEAPICLAYSFRNRSAAIRIPNTGSNPKAKRLEFRTPDPAANIYLCLAGLLMAGLDGVLTKADPGKPIDKDIYDLPLEERKLVPSVPANLEKAIEALNQSREFLMRGEVFTGEFLDTWTDYKYSKEVIPAQMRPTPFEYFMYFDV